MTQPSTAANQMPGVEIPSQGAALLDFFNRCLSPRTIVREDGLVVYRNRPKWAVFDVLPEEQVGKSLLELEPREVMVERVELMKQLAREERDGLVRTICSGRQFITHLYLLPASPGQDLRFFVAVTEQALGQQQGADGIPLHEPTHQDLGPLRKLSPRELEVLAMVGQGLRAAVIAQRLHRSVDTIKGHKAALLKKLNCANFVQLALIAHTAGLKVEDSARYATRRRGNDGTVDASADHEP
ncbi:MAG: response regulator transcription factor [Phycisphaerales bacterium]